MATVRATTSASVWRAMPIDPRRRVARRLLAIIAGAALGLAGAALARAAEKDAAPSAAADHAERERTDAPAPRDPETTRGKPERPAPLIVPSEEVSVDSAISFPADI